MNTEESILNNSALKELNSIIKSHTINPKDCKCFTKMFLESSAPDVLFVGKGYYSVARSLTVIAINTMFCFAGFL